MSIFISTGSTLESDDQSPFSKEVSPSCMLNPTHTITAFPNFKENLEFIPEEPINIYESQGLEGIPVDEIVKGPIELLLNFDAEGQRIKESPFLVYDERREDFREIRKSDGYLHFWSKLKQPKIHEPLKYMICVTIFTEPMSELQSTLSAIYENIKHFKTSGLTEQQICVTVMFDGLKAISPDIRKEIFCKIDQETHISEGRTLDSRELSFFRDLEQINKGSPNMKPISSCYLYEWDYKPTNEPEGGFTMKTLLAVKLQNGSKMSSMVWFFRGFAELLTPGYVGLIDCGTIPGPDSIFKKFMAFERDEDVGGLCGMMLPKVPVCYEVSEMEVMNLPPRFVKILYNLFDLKASQLFEYAVGHIIDKSFESLLGFMYVLPGAFCSFRWKAVCRDESNSTFMDNKFVKMVIDANYKTSQEFTLETGNLAQAEDQVITFDVNTKQGCKYKTEYLPDAVVWTDPVKTFPVLMKQRKRWINGSWFAFQLCLGVFFDKMNKTLHHPLRKTAFHCYMFYMIWQNINRYLLISYIFCLFLIMCEEFLSSFKVAYMPLLNPQVFYMLYFLVCLYLMYYYSVVFKADRGVSKFQTIATFFGFSIHLFTILLIVRLCQTIQMQDYAPQDTQHIDLRFIYLFLGFNGMYYIVPFLLNLKTCGWDILKSGPSFFYHMPLYMIFFQIYAFCNIDDLTWGTKARENLALGAKIANNRKINAKFVGKWLLINFLVGFCIMIFISNLSFRVLFILIMGFMYIFLAAFKFVGAIVFKLKYDFYDSREMKRINKENFEKYQTETKKVLQALSEEEKINEKETQRNE